MKAKKLSTVFWIKAIIWLLLVMLIFTIASRAADSFTVAKVSIENPSARKIQHNVKIYGMVVKNREISVLTQPNILVKSILVSEGQHVKKGDILVKLSIASLNECIKGIENEKKILELQNKSAIENVKQAEEQNNRDIARANEDLTQVKKQNEAAIVLAKRELQIAEKSLEKQKSKLDKIRQKLETARKKKGKDISNIRTKKKEQESIVASFKETVSEKKKALSAAYQTQKTEERAAERVLQDARLKASSDTDNTIDINNISIENYNIQLKKLKKLKEQKGSVYAPKSGIITAIIVTVGQKTPDTAIFTMTDDSVGLKFTGQINVDDAKYVSAGDTVSLQSANKSADNIRITSIEADESTEFMNVIALLPAKKFSLGESVVMEAVQMSGSYNCTVPITAVYQEDSKNYVLVSETENTVMGEQDIVRKVEVTVLEKNDLYAALDPSTLEIESQVIVNTDRYVKSGDRIRKI